MGTGLTLVGAYVLASELGPADALTGERVRTSLQRYENVMRPYIDRCRGPAEIGQRLTITAQVTTADAIALPA